MLLIELPDLSIGSPTEIAVARLSQEGTGYGVEATSVVEASRELIRNRLVVDEAVQASRADGQFVELLGLERASFDAGHLPADEGASITEGLGSVARPDRQLSVGGAQS